MEWRDEGIILGTRRHGETSAILEVMTAAHGRHLGLVRGGRSRRMQPLLQAGNKVDLVWRARLDEHLGVFSVDPLEHNAARLMGNAAAIHGLQLMAAHMRLMPERESHAGMYEALGVIIAHLDDVMSAGELVARFELLLLEELGFGMDLARCAATGTRDGLAWVSPKSGRAVSAEAGRPYAGKLLPLPPFLARGANLRADAGQLVDAFALTGYFLDRHVWSIRGTPAPLPRAAFVDAIRRAQSENALGRNAS